MHSAHCPPAFDIIRDSTQLSSLRPAQTHPALGVVRTARLRLPLPLPSSSTVARCVPTLCIASNTHCAEVHGNASFAVSAPCHPNKRLHYLVSGLPRDRTPSASQHPTLRAIYPSRGASRSRWPSPYLACPPPRPSTTPSLQRSTMCCAWLRSLTCDASDAEFVGPSLTQSRRQLHHARGNR